MLNSYYRPISSRGFSLLEVLITMLILAFGLLGIAGLIAKSQTSQFESYQRAQATLLLSNMAERIAANYTNAGSYVTTSPLGTNDGAQASTCTGTGATLDKCQWSRLLQGAGETASSANVGAMIGARGCIEQIQASDSSAGVCTPGIYRVTVAWQGLNKTQAPSQTCGQSLYGDDAMRRAVSTQVTIGLPSCT